MGSGISTVVPACEARGLDHRWKVLGVGFAANVSFAAAFSGIPTTAVLLRAGYHLGNNGLGVALGMLGLGIATSELPWGLLTDRWGDRPVLLLGLGTTAVALAGMAPLLSLGSWPLVWGVACMFALIALPVFPRAITTPAEALARG